MSNYQAIDCTKSIFNIKEDIVEFINFQSVGDRTLPILCIKMDLSCNAVEVQNSSSKTPLLFTTAFFFPILIGYYILALRYEQYVFAPSCKNWRVQITKNINVFLYSFM